MLKAIIGGTGVYDIVDKMSEKAVWTEYGEVLIDVVEVQDEEIAFLARHGKNHSVPPHLINYRANMKALKKVGVKYVYSTAAVGSMNEKYKPGSIVVIKDFMDFTKSRPSTFYEGKEKGVVHVDMREPYCRNLIKLFYEEAKKENLPIAGEGVYVCTEGPRFETASEIKMYKSLGGDVVGMTNVPEVVLAKELGMCYSTVGIVTNWCSGIDNLDTAIHDISQAIGDKKEKITKIFTEIFKRELDQENCKCNKSFIRLK
jgi:5'-methylthioadenosine phosphorylase